MNHNLMILAFIFLCFTTASCGQNSNEIKSSSENEIDVGELFIEGINTESEDRRKELVHAVFSKTLIDSKGEEFLESLFVDYHSRYAPMDYHHYEVMERISSFGGGISMHIYGKKRGEAMYQNFQVFIDDAKSKKINKIFFIAEVSEPINLPNGSIKQSETRKWLSDYIDKLEAENDLSGNILIAEGDKILFEKGFGFEDKSKTALISGRSLFSLASGGKMFTALTIAALVEEGKISYSDPITKFIDGFLDVEMAKKITIHHLLSHTSGVGQYWWGQESEDFKNAKTINDHLKMVLEVGIKSEAGKEYEYCNSNYILLGAIIEKVTKKDYHSVVEERVFQKADMSETGFFEKGMKGLVTPYIRSSENSKEWIPISQNMGRGSSAGGVYSNSYDILKFSLALKNNKIVTKETFANMITQKNDNLIITEEYGYGFILEKWQDEKTFGHGGTSKGVNFEFRYFPNQDITLIIFCNQDNGAYDDLKRNSIKLISGAR